MAIKFSNLASTTLASGVSSTATSVSVTSASSFPTLGSGDYFYATIGAGSGSEIVKVTGISGTTFTVSRGEDGTTAVSHSAGVDVALRVTAGTLEDLRDGGQVYTAGSGLGLSGNEFTNTAPDQTVSISGSGSTTVTGTYPSFTVSSTSYSHPSAHPISFITGLQTALDGKVDDSQVLTNVPSGALFTDTVYTLPFTDNSTNWNTAYGWGDHSTGGYLTSHQSLSGYATETYVGTQISNLVDSSPAALNTLNELAAALGDDPNFATTVSTSIGTKLPLAGGTLTGALSGTTATFSGSVSISGTSSLSTEFKIGNLTWNQNSSSTSGLLHQYRGSDGYSELQINNTSTSGAVALNIRNASTSVATINNDGSSVFSGAVTADKYIMTGGSQIGQDYAYLKSNSTSNASLTLRKDSTGADSIDFLQLRSDGNSLIGKIEGDGDISFNNATFSGSVTAPSIRASSGHFHVNRSSDGASAIQVDATGVVVIPSNYFYVSASQGSYFSSTVRFRGTIHNDTGTDVTIGDTLNVTEGIKLNGTTVIDASRNLTNVHTISSTAFSSTNNGTNRFNVNIGGTGETWAANSRASLHLDGSSSAIIGFRHSGGNRGYIFSTGSTLEVLSYGDVHLLSNASASYFGKLSSGVWNTSHGYQVNGTTVIDSSRDLFARQGAFTHDDHNYVKIENTAVAKEQMVRFRNSQTNYWYAGIRTSAGIASTADFHIYSAALGDDVFALTTSGDLVAKRNLNTKTGSIQINGTTVIDSSRNLSNISAISIGQDISGMDTTYLDLDIAGGASIRGSSALYFGVTTNSVNSWKTRIGSNNTSTMSIDAAATSINGFGYNANVYGLFNTNGLQILGNTAWHAGNDGSGSGLDADLLDGQQGSYYNQSQFTGVTFTSRNSGNPIAIDNVTTNMVGYVNTSTAAGYADGAGFSAAYSSSWVGQLFVDFRTGKLSTRGKNNGTWQAHRFMWDNLNDGSGSGLDADTVDGIQGVSFLRSDATDTATGSVSLRAGGAHLGNHEFAASSTSTSYGSAAIELRESNYSASASATPPHLGFHWGNVVASSISMDSAGAITIRNNPGTAYENFRANNIYANGTNLVWHVANDGSGSGLDADLLDGQHGSYYANEDARKSVPSSGNYQITNSTSPQTLGTGYLRHDFLNSSGPPGSSYRSVLSISSYTSGSQWTQLSFNYNNGVNTPIYFRQNQYNGSTWGSWHQLWDSANDGSGSGLDADLLDGLQAHTGRNNEVNKVVRTDVNGYIQAGWINTTSGDSGIANDVVRIYCSNDAYLRYLGKSDFKVLMGLSKDTYDRRDYTSNTAYHTGVNAHGAYNMNDLFARGSGFIDVWGSPTGRPPTGGHFNGFQALHYSASNTYHHGMQMVMAAGDPSYTYLRGWWANGGSGYAWQKIWTDGNDGSGSGLDADLLDGQQGSYYMPASTTTIAQSDYVSGSSFSTNGPDSVLEYAQAASITDSKLAPSADWYNSIRMGHGDPYSYYSNTMAMKMTGGGSGTLYTQVISNNSAGGWNQYWHTNNDGSGSGLDADLLDGQQGSAYLRSNVSATNSVDLRAPIFYDSNNTGYYVDSGSESRFGTLRTSTHLCVGGLTNSSPSSVSTTGRITFGSLSTDAISNYSIGTTLENYGGNYNKLDLAFHTGIRLGAHPSYGGVRFYTDQTMASEIFAVGKSGNFVQAANSMRAPLFYDSNNTGFYFDGSTTGTSIRIGGDILIDQQYGKGVVGVYTSTVLQHVWSMGAAYRISANGNGTGNMYGLAWSHPNAGSLGGANNLNDHGLLLINNGGFRAAISSRAVFSADVRGTLFYDYNDTAYYVDPHSISNIRRLILASSANTTFATPNIMSYGSSNSGGVANYHMRFLALNGNSNGNISTNYYQTTYATTSDYRVKEDFQPMVNATSRLMSLNPVNFQWKDSDIRTDGFLAHEVAEVVSDAVVGEKDAVDEKGNDELQSLDQSKLVPLLVKTIQEQQSVIEALEARISALEA